MLRARFEDAAFFYNSDLDHTLADFKVALKNVAYQQDLGSMLDKTDRVEKLVQTLAEMSNQTGRSKCSKMQYTFLSDTFING